MKSSIYLFISTLFFVSIFIPLSANAAWGWFGGLSSCASSIERCKTNKNTCQNNLEKARNLCDNRYDKAKTSCDRYETKAFLCSSLSEKIRYL